MAVNLGGLGLGTAAIGALSEYVFSGPFGLGKSLASLSFMAASLAAFIAARGLPRHAERMRSISS
jgi:hypothetical protein